MVFGTDAGNVKGVGGAAHGQNEIFVIDLKALVHEHFLAPHNFIFEVQTGRSC